MRGEMKPLVKQGTLHCKPLRPLKYRSDKYEKYMPAGCLWCSVTQGGHTQSWKERKLVEAILSSGKEKANEKKTKEKDKGDRQEMERERTEPCFSMQMGSFIRSAIILIISYSNSSS